MEVVHPQCSGLDVHKETVVACILVSQGGTVRKTVRTFKTHTSDLLALSDWLSEQEVTHVAMESTGVYWKPIYNVLEGQFELLLVNAQHIKAVPGRNYYRSISAYRTFRKMDAWMFYREVRYVKRTHPQKPKYWMDKRYWGRLNLDRYDRWVFGDKQTGQYLIKFAWHKIVRHVLVTGTNSPDDPQLKNYWKKRKEREVTNFSLSWQKIAKNQNFKCPVCGQTLFNDEDLHKHHVQPKRENGPETYRNYRLVHLYCHQQITDQHAKRKTAAKAQ